ncbi:hypothetical protein ACFFIX_20460 [Metabacillus herbersteinensis]|uniref:TerB-C domain-containing protein n=1 Tax=Metabacillus herbersteinensis TaxID=283816 RepID=A0ABV6GJX6_9BACI
MDIVQNTESSLQDKIYTHVALSAEFLRALYNIELKYNSDITFPIVEEGATRSRSLHHLTTCDIVTTIVLHVACNSIGQIRETNPHNLYTERLCKLFHDPITYQEFKISLKKLELNSLIEVVKNKYTKRYTIQLNHFFNKEKERVERYVIAHPVVFSKGFTNLSISHIKLYFSLIWQQGNNKEFKFSRVLDASDRIEAKCSDVIMSDLKSMLHKQQNSDVRRVLYDLISFQLVNDQALFEKIPGQLLLTKKGKRFYKVQVRLNPYYYSQAKKGDLYRIPLEPQETYQREAQYIRQEINLKKIGELEVLYKGKLFRELLYILKDRSKAAINHSISAIQEYVNYYGKFPYDLQNFVIQSIKHLSIINYSKIAREEGLLNYITHNKEKPIDREIRMFDFVSKMSYYSLREFRRMCKIATPILEKFHTKAAVHEPANYEDHFIGELDAIKGIGIVRQIAVRSNVDPIEYSSLEQRIVDLLKSLSEKEIAKLLMEGVADLTRLDVVPDLPNDFDLEHFLINEYKCYIRKIAIK